MTTNTIRPGDIVEAPPRRGRGLVLAVRGSHAWVEFERSGGATHYFLPLHRLIPVPPPNSPGLNRNEPRIHPEPTTRHPNGVCL